MHIFSGLWAPLITPFGADGALDLASLDRLTRHLVQAGLDGLVVCGTTGEPATLSTDEKALVLGTVQTAAPQLPLVMGVTGVAPAAVASECRQWARQGVAGFLVPPPAYVRPSQQGIVHFYEHVAAEAGRPLIVYDIPYRTGVTLELDTLRALADLRGVQAVKDCGGDAHKTQALIADGRLQILAGEDHQIFGTLCQGGAGAIAASAHLHTDLFVALHTALREGHLPQARALHHALAPLVRTLFSEPNPGPLKAALAMQGLIATPTVRPPLTPARPTTVQALTRAMDAARQASA
ncbi:4-hydroxy-tetrahydrodipicolinate synthase [Aquabacterium soli]|uniref:4-hydroxy-tetrahydrodipicolinate synthase n=1 Tax=Aquabacterium soli TaxID=2493092 RepID=UPI001F225D62|nr:4-hydroxy-tetrahydrodipicolinate synthase [Aquabacterium soli]